MLLAPFIGKYIFKFHPAINLGCCGGARTSTASVAMVADVAKSNVPMLGYTVPYAVSNTLLTLWGMVIVPDAGVSRRPSRASHLALKETSMDELDLNQYEKLGPFEIKDFLAKVARSPRWNHRSRT